MKPAPPQQGRRGLGAREPAPAPDLRPAGCFRNVSRSRQHRRNRQPSSVSLPFRPFRDRPWLPKRRVSGQQCRMYSSYRLAYFEPRPVQKHKRTQHWRAGPFRSSSPRGETQIWGVSEAMSPSSNGMPRSRAETWIQARAAPGPERASRLRCGSPGLDSGPLGRPLFRRCTALSAARSPIWRKRGTRKSRLETKTENEASSALLARLW